MRLVKDPEFAPIKFRPGRASIRDEEEPALRKIAEFMKKEPTSYLELQGHHKEEAGEQMALDRAKAVMRWLQEEGEVPAARMKAIALDIADSEGTRENPEPIVSLGIFRVAP